MLATYSHIQALELELERSHKNFSIACEQEESRRLRVDVLFLQDENAELQAELLEREEAFDAVCEDVDKANAWIEDLRMAMDNLRVELRLKIKDADRMKSEINKLQAQSEEFAKVLEDKLSLEREVNILRPEVEHMRTQQSSSATILSEKLSLQRELQTLQVELENEKRAVHKALSRDEGRSTREAKLELEIETCKVDLAKEKTLRQKFEREVNKTKGQHEVEAASNESKLEEYRSKLKSAKDQIKGVKAELEEARKANERLTQQSLRQPQANRGKRTFKQMDEDGTIGTPDGFPPKKTAQLLLGEKSGFGLTPFLKQSKKLIIEAQNEKSDDDEVAIVGSVKEPVSSTAEPTLAQAKRAAPAPPAFKTKTQPTKISKAMNHKATDPLEDIEEETAETDKPVAKLSIAKETKPIEPAPKKKRRMLGGGQGKTLFDDDDTGNINARGGLDDFKFAMPKRITLAPKGATALAAKSSSKTTFGAFSPLKKDRKK